MSDQERMETVALAWNENRADLVRFVRRMVIRPETAEDIVQQTGQRAIAAATAPSAATELRKWLFRIASNLAIDELRRQGTWPQTVLFDSRADAENDPEFVLASESLRGSPEAAAIASEHLSFCFACTTRALPPEHAASLLLVEVFGFTVKETASILDASFAQAKNWLQSARADIDARYADTCALIHKQGVCYQCSELAEFFQGRPENPLAASNGTRQDRLCVIASAGGDTISPWHTLLLRVIDRRTSSKRP